MKILMCNTFNYLRGGAERCFIGLSDLLEAHGHEVIKFCMHHPQNEASPYENYFVSYIDFPTALAEEGLKGKGKVFERVVYSREAKRKIETLIQTEQPDLVHIHGIAHEISPSILPGIKKFGLPVVQTLHDYKLLCPNTNFVSNNELCERCKGHRYFQAVRHRCKRGSFPASLLAGLELYIHKSIKIYEKNIDTFISPSQFLADKFAAYGIRNPVVNIPNFIQTDDFYPDYEPDDYFMFFGRLVEIKGIRTLLEAMVTIKRSRLVIAGSGELEDELKAFCADEGIENVEFLGHLSTSRIIPLLQKARFVVMPSEWYENYSMAVLEAFACGTPVLGANIGGIPEQVLPGKTGLLFESGNAEELAGRINEMLSNPERAIEMGKNARHFVETNNNPLRHYAATMQVYEHLLAVSNGRAEHFVGLS